MTISWGTNFDDFSHVAWEEGGGWLFRARSKAQAEKICEEMAEQGHYRGGVYTSKQMRDYVDGREMGRLSRMNILIPFFPGNENETKVSSGDLTHKQVLDHVILELEMLAVSMKTHALKLRAEAATYDLHREALKISEVYAKIAQRIVNLMEGEYAHV